MMTPPPDPSAQPFEAMPLAYSAPNPYSAPSAPRVPIAHETSVRAPLIWPGDLAEPHEPPPRRRGPWIIASVAVGTIGVAAMIFAMNSSGGGSKPTSASTSPPAIAEDHVVMEPVGGAPSAPEPAVAEPTAALAPVVTAPPVAVAPAVAPAVASEARPPVKRVASRPIKTEPRTPTTAGNGVPVTRPDRGPAVASATAATNRSAPGLTAPIETKPAEPEAQPAEIKAAEPPPNAKPAPHPAAAKPAIAKRGPRANVTAEELIKLFQDVGHQLVRLPRDQIASVWSQYTLIKVQSLVGAGPEIQIRRDETANLLQRLSDEAINLTQ